MISPIQVTDKKIIKNLEYWKKPKYEIANHHHSSIYKDRNIVVVSHIYPPVTGQSQTLHIASLFIAITARLEKSVLD